MLRMAPQHALRQQPGGQPPRPPRRTHPRGQQHPRQPPLRRRCRAVCAPPHVPPKRGPSQIPTRPPDSFTAAANPDGKSRHRPQREADTDQCEHPVGDHEEPRIVRQLGSEGAPEQGRRPVRRRRGRRVWSFTKPRDAVGDRGCHLPCRSARWCAGRCVGPGYGGRRPGLAGACAGMTQLSGCADRGSCAGNRIASEVALKSRLVSAAKSLHVQMVDRGSAIGAAHPAAPLS